MWHQGENDCTSDEKLLSHKEKFITMITSLRRDLNAEDLPLLIGELADEIAPRWGLGERPAEMNRRYHEIAAILPHCSVVSAKGLSQKPDGLHFDSVALREFGHRYFAEYLRLLGE